MSEGEPEGEAVIEYTFGDRDWLQWMPVVDTCRYHGRLHECPICGARLWTVLGYPNQHWKSHGAGEVL